MKTVREMFVSLTAMLINHIWASIIEICVEKWRTQSLKKIEIQMSRHEKRYRSEEMSPGAGQKGTQILLSKLTLNSAILFASSRAVNISS